MAGPVVSVLVPQQLGSDEREALRERLYSRASEVKGDDFWVYGRPLILSIGMDNIDFKETLDVNVPDIIGWEPGDSVTLSAMCNEGTDHRLLGEMSLDIATATDGLIDMCGAITPPIEGEVRDLFDERYRGKGNGWDKWKPHVDGFLFGAPGKLYSVPYGISGGIQWVSHIADPEFMEWWLQHPSFHMIK